MQPVSVPQKARPLSVACVVCGMQSTRVDWQPPVVDPACDNHPKEDIARAKSARAEQAKTLPVSNPPAFGPGEPRPKPATLSEPSGVAPKPVGNMKPIESKPGTGTSTSKATPTQAPPTPAKPPMVQGASPSVKK